MSLRDAPWIGYPKDYWDEDDEEYVDDCLIEEDEEDEDDASLE